MVLGRFYTRPSTLHGAKGNKHSSQKNQRNLGRRAVPQTRDRVTNIYYSVRQSESV